MLTLYDYLPSRNAWKVRQLLHHLQRPFRQVLVSIFEGEGRSPAFLRINPSGRVPAIELEDGRTLAESNAILAYSPTARPTSPPRPTTAHGCTSGCRSSRSRWNR